jgi:hypothetical protein
MALPFTPLSNQRNNQPRIPLTEFEPLGSGSEQLLGSEPSVADHQPKNSQGFE